MGNTLNIYKPVGYTPYDLIKHLQSQKKEYASFKIGYAGRLDPQAEGVLLLLLGEENKKKHAYENLDKEYEFELLCGLSTDTYDIMGIPENGTLPTSLLLEKKLKTYLTEMTSSFTMTYPPYSSVRVNGKPLYFWARRNLLSTITIPKKQVTLFDIKLIQNSSIDSPVLLEEIRRRICLVDGDFRQTEIMNKWEEILQKPTSYPLFKIKIHCSAGTYVRSICQYLGNTLGCGALAFTINRTRVGPHLLKDSLQLI